MSELFTLFPTPVYRFSVAGHRKFKQTIVPKLLDTFKKEPNRKAPWAKLCNTWQIHLEEINPKDFEIISADIQLAIETYLAYLQVPPFSYEYHGWINVHDSDMYQEVHNHIPAIISGIYYIQFDTDKDNSVQFINPNPVYNTLMDTLNLNVHNPMMSPRIGLNFNEGDMILFPSTLDHFVPKAKQPHDQLRISLSFNVSPTSVHPSGRMTT